MKKQYESDGRIIRSGTRIRESVRCLPRGHFQQIRQMFDKRIPNQKVCSSHILYKLPVTNNENLQDTTTTNIDDIILENDESFKSFQSEEQLLKSTLSMPNEKHFYTTGRKKKTHICF
jgi:hypothetical protein